MQLFLLGGRKSKSVPWFAGKWPVFYELAPVGWEWSQNPWTLGMAYEASWPGHISGLPIRSAFLSGSYSFQFSFSELTMQNDPAYGMPFPTALGKMPWARLEAEVAWKIWCQAFKCVLCEVVSGLSWETVWLIQPRLARGKCSVVFRLCIYPSKVWVFHSTVSRNYSGLWVGINRVTSWLRIRIQILDLNMPWSYHAPQVIHIVSGI